MKINTFIITILNIKIEDSKFTALIFKCLQYIDQHNPVSLQSQSLSQSPRRGKKRLFKREKKNLPDFFYFFFFKMHLNLSAFSENSPSSWIIGLLLGWKQVLHQKNSPENTECMWPHTWTLSTSQVSLCIHTFFFKKSNEYTSDIKQRPYIISFLVQTANLDPNWFPEALHNIPEGG